MKFKVGDKVRVREDLEVGKYYDNCLFTQSMWVNKGDIFKIKTVNYVLKKYEYELECDSYIYSEKMLEPVEKKNPEQRKKEDENYCYGISGNLLNPGHGQSVSPGKRAVKNIIGFEEKNCDNCKNYNTYFDCSQCSDFDEWEEKEDLIHKPLHYTYSKYEPIDVIKEWNLDFDLGNVVKYIARCEHKGNKLLDLNKALEYLQHEIKHLEN